MNIYSTNYGVTVVIKFRINIIYAVVIYKIPKFFFTGTSMHFPPERMCLWLPLSTVTDRTETL